MVIDRYDPLNLFERIPSLTMQMDPLLAQIDHLLDQDAIFQAVKAVVVAFPRLCPTIRAPRRPSARVAGWLIQVRGTAPWTPVPQPSRCLPSSRASRTWTAQRTTRRKSLAWRRGRSALLPRRLLGSNSATPQPALTPLLPPPPRFPRSAPLPRPRSL